MASMGVACSSISGFSGGFVRSENGLGPKIEEVAREYSFLSILELKKLKNSF